MKKTCVLKSAEAAGGEADSERCRRLVEGLKGEYFFYQHGTDGILTYVSPSVKDVLGYEPPNFLKHYTRYLTASPANKEARLRTAKAIKGRRQPAYRLEARHRDGSVRWLEILEFPVRARGRVVSVEGIAHDVTRLVQAQEEIERYRTALERKVGDQTAELEAVFERAPVLMVLLDDKLRVVRTNAAARSGRLIGEVLECINAKGGGCGRGADCAGCLVRLSVTGTLLSGRGISKQECGLVAASGDRLFFLLSTALIKTGAGRQLLLCLDDITPQKEAEEALRKAQAMKTFLTQSIVHDLKNPIASILLAAQLLEEEAVGLPAAQLDMLGILNFQAHEMKRMVANILDISRLEEGKMPLKAGPFQPLRLLREVADSLAITARYDRKHIKVRADGAPEKASGDPELLRRVVENLISNALKFSPAGGEVTVGARPAAGGGVEFYVKDNGPGIPKEQHTCIFDKFVQVETPWNRPAAGSGMGLAFCKLAVETHGGGIRVESAPGAGSTFTFSIPPGLPGKKKLV